MTHGAALLRNVAMTASGWRSVLSSLRARPPSTGGKWPIRCAGTVPGRASSSQCTNYITSSKLLTIPHAGWILLTSAPCAAPAINPALHGESSQCLLMDQPNLKHQSPSGRAHRYQYSSASAPDACSAAAMRLDDMTAAAMRKASFNLGSAIRAKSGGSGQTNNIPQKAGRQQ